jgi:hypothetical protein
MLTAVLFGRMLPWWVWWGPLQLVDTLPALRRKGGILPVKTVAEAVRAKVGVDVSWAKLVAVLEFVMDMGEIIFFPKVPGLAEMVIVDPRWFGTDVIGRVSLNLAPTVRFAAAMLSFGPVSTVQRSLMRSDTGHY